ncbi:hypothetical protein D3C80_1922540 [compost metagenome]
MRITVAGLGVVTPLTEMSQVLPSTEPLKWMMLVVGEARAAWLATATRVARESRLNNMDVLLVRVTVCLVTLRGMARSVG